MAVAVSEHLTSTAADWRPHMRISTESVASYFWDAALALNGRDGHGAVPAIPEDRHADVGALIDLCYVFKTRAATCQAAADDLLALAKELSRRSSTTAAAAAAAVVGGGDSDDDADYLRLAEDMQLKEGLIRALKMFLSQSIADPSAGPTDLTGIGAEVRQEHEHPSQQQQQQQEEEEDDDDLFLPSTDTKEERREAVVSLWKQESKERWKLESGEPLQEGMIRALRALGFVDEVPYTLDMQQVPLQYALLPGAGLLGMNARFRYLNRLLKEKCTEATAPKQLVVLAGHRRADTRPGSGDDPSRLPPNGEWGCPMNIRITADSTETSMARDLCSCYAELPEQPEWLAQKWRNACHVDTSDIAKPHFGAILWKWVRGCSVGGGVMLVIEQPFLPRYRVQLHSALQRTRAFRHEPLVVVGAGASESQLRRGNIVLDAVAHWCQACRESEL